MATVGVKGLSDVDVRLVVCLFVCLWHRRLPCIQ